MYGFNFKGLVVCHADLFETSLSSAKCLSDFLGVCFSLVAISFYFFSVRIYLCLSVFFGNKDPVVFRAHTSREICFGKFAMKCLRVLGEDVV